jgi:hypothetical protein
MEDHPLVKSFTEFLETHKQPAGLLIIPAGNELRLVGSGVDDHDIYMISKSLSRYMEILTQPMPEGKPN